MRTKHASMFIAHAFSHRTLLPVLLCVTLLSCKKQETTSETTVTSVVPVRATTVHTGYVEDLLTVTGKTSAIRMEKIVAPIAGRVLELNGVEGMSVAAGGVIARIETKEAQAAVEGARVLLAQAKSAEEKSHAEQMLADAERTTNGVTVRSTIAGVIATKSTNQGEYVAEGQEILTIVDPSSTAFIAEVPLGELGKIRMGTQARITIPGIDNVTFSSHVFAIKPHVVAESQVAQVVLQFDHIPPSLVAALRTDANGTAQFVLSAHGAALVVPKSALVRNDLTNGYTIVTFGSDSLSRSLDVARGNSRDSVVEISGDNVTEGMNVIFEGQYALADSTRITVVH